MLVASWRRSSAPRRRSSARLEPRSGCRFPASTARSLGRSCSPAIGSPRHVRRRRPSRFFHGCGGVVDRRGRLSRRMRDYAALFNRAGFHALVVDSLTPRYEVEICTQRAGARRVTQANRRLDALGALAYLADRPDVYAQRIGLVGWSNGGSAVLAATNLRHPGVAAARTRPAFAVAFYPRLRQRTATRLRADGAAAHAAGRRRRLDTARAVSRAGRDVGCAEARSRRLCRRPITASTRTLLCR